MRELRPVAIAREDPRDRPQDKERNHDCAASMGEVDIYADPDERRHPMSERSRKVRNPQPRAEMPHHRANQNLCVNDGGSSRREDRCSRTSVVTLKLRSRAKLWIREERH